MCSYVSAKTTEPCGDVTEYRDLCNKHLRLMNVTTPCTYKGMGKSTICGNRCFNKNNTDNPRCFKHKQNKTTVCIKCGRGCRSKINICLNCGYFKEYSNQLIKQTNMYNYIPTKDSKAIATAAEEFKKSIRDIKFCVDAITDVNEINSIPNLIKSLEITREKNRMALDALYSVDFPDNIYIKGLIPIILCDEECKRERKK